MLDWRRHPNCFYSLKFQVKYRDRELVKQIIESNGIYIISVANSDFAILYETVNTVNSPLTFPAFPIYNKAR